LRGSDYYMIQDFDSGDAVHFSELGYLVVGQRIGQTIADYYFNHL
jgi:hypothetical protein